jgi:hypothetical protein
MSDPVASHRIASHRIASHRIASHRIASHRIASHRMNQFDVAVPPQPSVPVIGCRQEAGCAGGSKG